MPPPLLFRVFLVFSSATARVMNAGGVPYTISNPDLASKTAYSTDFEANVDGPVEHFDMYGEVRTRYSETYWTRNAPIALPEELIKRFADGGVMAITGYEVDQVVHEGAPPPPPGSDKLGGFGCFPSCDETDRSVPIYHAYNHHYFAWLLGTGAEVFDKDQPTHAPNPSWTGVRDRARGRPNPHGYPTSIVFKENPGGEYRKSYHGYPRGYAQLLLEPTTWIFEPMQIDTHHRDYKLTDAVGYHQWHLPAVVTNASVTDLESGASPLLECPCTDRITKYLNESGESYLIYDGHTKVRFAYDCADEPRGDMLRHGAGAGSHGANAACRVATYHGGLQ